MTKSTLSNSRKSVFILLTGLFIWLIIEIISYGYLRIVDGDNFGVREYQVRRQALIEDYSLELEQEQAEHLSGLQLPETVRQINRNLVLHPYLGYSNEYSDNRCPDYGFCDRRSIEYGRVLGKKSDQKTIVGIFGGSFAEGVSVFSSPGYLEQVLGKLPQFAGREIIIFTFAVGGFKQPQQLMALNYFLTLGMEFDYVINIDGFNEIVLPIVDGLPFGTHPIYPRGWAVRLQGSFNKEMLVMAGAIEYYKKKRFRLARMVNQSPLRLSPLINLLWKMVDDNWAGKVHENQLNLAAYSAEGKFRTSFAATGPYYPVPERNQVYRDLAQIWVESSRQMANLSRANDIHYYHFLQPNQYLAGSKPMGPEEKKIALQPLHQYRIPATDGYPFLREAGEELNQQNVPYFDLTQVFADNPEILYIDDCCHLNQQGYDLIVDSIVDVIDAEDQ